MQPGLSGIRTHVLSSPAVADAITGIPCLARLDLEDEEVQRLVVWTANRLGRNQALAAAVLRWPASSTSPAVG